ncbi:hypothetical protein I7I51_02718 [Histoplasma capsulatum]|uniref:Uncharacterized protein n=1 Tax=Ajellomyces capsulatus TaxID=5037 RepID=A0A8A1MMW2_AJECA|nr:hypothetical protein I7I51_02718 [Histoplasma capsulatum]
MDADSEATRGKWRSILFLQFSIQLVVRRGHPIIPWYNLPVLGQANWLLAASAKNQDLFQVNSDPSSVATQTIKNLQHLLQQHQFFCDLLSATTPFLSPQRTIVPVKPRAKALDAGQALAATVSHRIP